MSRSPISKSSKLLADVRLFLDSFKASKKKFALFRRFNNEQEITSGSPATRPKTLFILDSSYNPPSRAHFTLACSALASPAATHHAQPHGLLLLFSTANADKAPQPASFEQRLAMMSCLVEDITQTLSQRGVAAADVGIGVTTEPYYVGKSLAIAADLEAYPGRPKHVHIVGYDTVTRLLAPKYYPDYRPPLSALEPYFGAGHGLLVALRPESSSENIADAGSQAVEEQRAYVEKLSDGALRDEGFQAHWAGQIGVMEGDDLQAAVGISSTAIRRAVKAGHRVKLEQLCTPHVAAWIVGQELYLDDTDASAKG